MPQESGCVKAHPGLKQISISEQAPQNGEEVAFCMRLFCLYGNGCRRGNTAIHIATIFTLPGDYAIINWSSRTAKQELNQRKIYG